MRAFTDKEVLDRISKLDTFKGWPNGPLDVWITGGPSKPTTAAATPPQTTPTT